MPTQCILLCCMALRTNSDYLLTASTDFYTSDAVFTERYELYSEIQLKLVFIFRRLMISLPLLNLMFTHRHQNCYRFQYTVHSEFDTKQYSHLIPDNWCGWQVGVRVSNSGVSRVRTWSDNQFSWPRSCHHFSQSLQGNEGTKPKVWIQPFPSASFPIHSSLIVFTLDVISF
jgi:hypothetical protein